MKYTSGRCTQTLYSERHTRRPLKLDEMTISQFLSAAGPKRSARTALVATATACAMATVTRPIWAPKSATLFRKATAAARGMEEPPLRRAPLVQPRLNPQHD